MATGCFGLLVHDANRKAPMLHATMEREIFISASSPPPNIIEESCRKAHDLSGRGECEA